jgi:hypothetical protein
MKRLMFRPVLALAILAASVSVAPAHAGVGDGWVLIDSGTISGTGPDIDPIVNAVVGIIANTGKDKVCTPKSSSINPGNLSWSRYRTPDYLKTAFEWHGPGFASISDDCAEELRLFVEVTDTSPSGDPASAQGDPGSAWDPTPSGGMFNTAATSHDFVLYYDLERGYVRGVKTVIEVKVTATYYNRKAKSWLPIGCRATHTVITPTPDGPSDATTGPVEDCGA